MGELSFWYFLVQIICHIEPPQKLNLFIGWDFSTFFLLIWFKRTKMKFRPYFTMERVQKLMKKTYKYLIYSPLTEDNFTEWPGKFPSHFNWLGFVSIAVSQSQQSPNEFLFVSFWSEFFTSLQLSHLSKVI